jgi:MoaA/NifB/PqqE/SkfB family radical SAM enzyme
MNIHNNKANLVLEAGRLSDEEMNRRNGLAARKPYVASKLAKISEMEERGEISPIIRLEKSYLCNFKCTHCSAEYYMDRHLKNVVKTVDDRQKMDMNDVRRISEEADQAGLARFVITGGEPLVMRDFDQVVEAIDPDKHYVITDTNGWFLDNKKAKHLKSIGVEKVQLSLDSMIEAEHDAFREKKHSYSRVMRAIDATLDEGLNLLVSTVLVKGRADTKEFREMCNFCDDRGVGLYVSYAKPTGSATDHPEFVIEKRDADVIRELEKKHKVFTHMTPSYGSFKGCITVKGIITITNTMEITPCPYIDFSIGNLRQDPLKKILDRGMNNPWIGPHRPDCLIGEDPKFIKIHQEKTKDAKLLPLSWGEGFTDTDDVTDEVEVNYDKNDLNLFDEFGRCIPKGINSQINIKSRRYFYIKKKNINLDESFQRITKFLPSDSYPTIQEYKEKISQIRDGFNIEEEAIGILNGNCIPFMLPKIESDDIGEEFENKFLPAVSNSYKDFFPNYEFTTHHHNSMAGTLETVKGSRHDNLVKKLKDQSVIGCYFPALSEYSVDAAIEIMSKLPERIILAGAYDTAAALISCPDLLYNEEHYAPLLWLSGVKAKQGEAKYFEAYGYNLTFNRRMHLSKNSEYFTSGITLLG